MSTTPITFHSVDGELFEFADPQDFLRYLEDECLKWQWVESHAEVAGEVVSEAILGIYESLKKAVSQVRESVNAAGSDLSASLADVPGYKRYLSFVPAIHDRAPLQEDLLSLAAVRPREAAIALAVMMYRGGVVVEPKLTKARPLEIALGASDALVWELRARSSVTIASEQLQSIAKQLPILQSKVSSVRTAATEELERIRDKVSAVEDERRRLSLLGSELEREVDIQKTNTLKSAELKVEASIAETNSQLAELRAEHEKRYKDAADQLETEWKRVASTYDDKLALQAPSTYWKAKAQSHARQAKLFAAVCAPWSAGGLVALYFAYIRVFGTLPATSIPTWSQVLTTALLALIYLWGIKTLLRLVMSHIHLSLDASERRTLIMSYLALGKKTDVTPEERQALFAAIFRPTGDGIVRDESPPLPLLEALRVGRGP